MNPLVCRFKSSWPGLPMTPVPSLQFWLMVVGRRFSVTGKGFRVPVLGCKLHDVRFSFFMAPKNPNRPPCFRVPGFKHVERNDNQN